MSSISSKRITKLRKELEYWRSELEYVQEILKEWNIKFEDYHRLYCREKNIDLRKLNKENSQRVKQIMPSPVIKKMTRKNERNQQNNALKKIYKQLAKKIHPDVGGDEEQFKQVVNAANTLGLPEIVVEGDGTAIRLVVSDTGNVSSDIFSIKVGVTDKTFRMVFKTENLNKVMEGSYDIELSSKRISHFKRKSDSLEYWIALEQNSTYEG